VPFLVSGPGIPANSQSDTPVVGYDLLPTIAELAGYPKRLPVEIDGGSLVGILKNDKGIVERQTEGLVFHRYASYLHSAIRVGDFKLLKFWNDNVNRKAGIELYDLSRDLGERNDLSMKMPVKASELERRLLDYIDHVDANVTGE